MAQKKLLLVSGFLGAGKTTLIGKAVKALQSSGVRCGVITNDQAQGLVDTRLAELLDATAISEIAGGCFCCRLGDLQEVLANQWSGDDSPDVIIAEPVGSCTDLMATVVLPLQRANNDSVRICPLVGVVDGRRALASLTGRRLPGDFSKDVGYIYRKQIEESENIVVNKSDLLSPDDLRELLDRLKLEFPAKKVSVLSARSGEGVEEWVKMLLNAAAAPNALMEVDYDQYGKGEALLGWCNAELEIYSSKSDDGGVSGDAFLNELATLVSSELERLSVPVAHFKMALQDSTGKLGVVNQVMSGDLPQSSILFGSDFVRATLIINLRAEGDPQVLLKALESSIGLAARSYAVDYRFLSRDAFQPTQPVPTMRMTSI